MSRLEPIVSLLIAAAFAASGLQAQIGVPPGFIQHNPQNAAPQPQQQVPPQQPSQQPQPATPPANTPPQTTQLPGPSASYSGGLSLQNASLRQVIEFLARSLKINYILDPRVQGGVTINTYGESKAIDNRALLDTILRMNGFAMVPHGDIFRIVPLSDVQRMPGLPFEVNDGKPLPDDDRAMLNLVFLKYATVDELAKLLDQFLGEHGRMWSYPPANLLLIQDTRRSMRRLMTLIGMFDSDTFAGQRVKLFEIKHSLPSDLAKELDGILKGISLNEKTSPIRLLPVDRINTLIAVAPNPGAFTELERWINKLDIAVEASAGSMDNYVYRVRYGFAPALAMAIMGLYSNNPMYAMSMMMMSSSMGMGMGGNINIGGGGMGMMGGGMGGMMGMGGMGMMPGMMGIGGMGMMPGMMGMGGMGMMPGMMGLSMTPGLNAPMASMPSPVAMNAAGQAAASGTNLTGTYLGNQGQAGMYGMDPKAPRVIPNPFDNTLLIQATRQEYEGILKLLRTIDVPPRQVLLEARIYEVTLSGALSSGVSAFLQDRGARAGGLSRSLTAGLANGGVAVTTGALVGNTRELLAAFSLQEVATNARVISAPSLIATDSVPASINVGSQVPTLTASAPTGVQSGGNSLFANSISNRDTGVTLQVMARVNPSGVVTLMINQEVSAPQATTTSDIQSPSFSRRTVQTQVTVQDGDTIAIAGIINEDNTTSSAGIPFLHRLPVVGAAFGSKSLSKARTELIIFMTPKVIYDTASMNDATDELRERLRTLRRHLKDEDR